LGGLGQRVSKPLEWLRQRVSVLNNIYEGFVQRLPVISNNLLEGLGQRISSGFENGMRGMSSLQKGALGLGRVLSGIGNGISWLGNGAVTSIMSIENYFVRTFLGGLDKLDMYLGCFVSTMSRIDDGLYRLFGLGGVIVTPKSAWLSIDGTRDLKANQDVTWSLEPPNSTVASVDSNGRVTALENGEVRIRATSTKNSKRWAECALTVSPPPTGQMKSKCS